MYLDLKSSLMLRLVAGALACFFIAAGFALFGTYRDVRQVNARVADLLARRLQIQLSHIKSGIDAATRFPDFDLVSEHLQSAGQCALVIGAICMLQYGAISRVLRRVRCGARYTGCFCVQA